MTIAIPDELRICSRQQTAELLDFPRLLAALATASADCEAGRIRSPERLVVPLGDGGAMLSMPATAHDIGIHKLVNVQPANARRGLPTIHGTVTVCDAATGRPLCMLDAPEVTGRRTAAVSLLAIGTLLGRGPRDVLIVGTGAQARHHVAALAALHPGCRVRVRGRDAAGVERFCREVRAVHPDVAACPAAIPAGVDAVITVTTSTEPVYDEPARADRVVVGVGAFRPDMAEIGRTTLDGSDLYADDPAGARHEAGDLMRAGVDWSTVRSLGALLAGARRDGRPAVFKSVGSAAWDLAAARVALAGLGLPA
ncbi:MAG TPA: bifunctional Delta(1)-pyrroline-2-carboxylate/Delta(1)-piperideine-2-carboxylate reductase [Burkholderiaceae bacterium]|jgi:1-piperideine-2-carboxylate/1-pyrroline-2-carboxylate reductase [NAD(P)H]|nr:bifunctional Delta(1)-pyrroline-2-carboxylate/Delta(1)-piperideine-2-carboxylate reductase [Burkholderiaceae bacterium]